MSNIHQDLRGDEKHPLVIAANKAAQDRDYLRGIELLEEANRRSPRNANILFNLGTMQARRYDYVAVERSFEQAIEVSPDKGRALVTAGGLSLAMSNDTLAQKYFTCAVEMPDPHPVALSGLAKLRWQQDRFPEAMELVERALHLDPECQTALLLQARLLSRSGNLKEAETILVQLAGNPGRKLRVRVAAGGELARVLDLQKNYDAAMAAVTNAKALLKPPVQVTQGFATLCERRRNLEEAGLGKKLGKWFKTVLPPVPLVLAGGQSYASEKIGIEQRLVSHEDIFYVEDSRIFLDEVYFTVRHRFPRDMPLVTVFDSLTPDQLTEMRSIYLKRNEVVLQKPIGGRLIVEKNHIFNSLLLAWIRVFPEARFLMMMRDPRDACLENFMQVQSVNPCSCGFLTLAGSVDENVATMNYWRNVMAIVGNPHMQLRLEDMVANSDLASGQSFSFLKVNPVSSSSPKTPAPSWGIGNWKNYRKYLEPHLPVLNKLAEEFGY